MENVRSEWRNFIRENRLTPWICAGAAALSYGVTLSGLRIGVDSEYNMYNPDELLISWYSINRYSLVWLKNLFGMRMLNPFAENLMMIAVLTLCGIFASFMFYSVSGGSRSMKGFCAVFPLLLITHPCYVQQYLFTLQAFEVAVCMLSCLAAAFCSARWACGGAWCFGVAGVLLMAFGFGGYQALVPFYMAAALGIYLVYFEFHENEKKGFYLKCALRHLAVFLAGYALYMLTGKMVTFYLFGPEFQGEYLEGQILWSSCSVQECIVFIKGYIRAVLLGENEFYPGTFFPFAALFALRLLWIWGRKRRREFVLYALAALALAVSPFYLCFYQGGGILMRSQMSLPFAAAFFGASLLSFVSGFLSEQAAGNTEGADSGTESGLRGKISAGHMLKPAAFLASAVLVICGINQGTTSSRAVLTAQMTYEADRMTAMQIAEGLRRLGVSEAGTHIAMLGQYHPPLPQSVSIRRESVGYSIFEWDHQGPAGVSRRGAGFMRVHGLPYEAATEEEFIKAKEYGASMPCWPSAGSMALMGDVVIVKFSEE